MTVERWQLGICDLCSVERNVIETAGIKVCATIPCRRFIRRRERARERIRLGQPEHGTPPKWVR